MLLCLYTTTGCDLVYTPAISLLFKFLLLCTWYVYIHFLSCTVALLYCILHTFLKGLVFTWLYSLITLQIVAQACMTSLQPVIFYCLHIVRPKLYVSVMSADISSS